MTYLLDVNVLIALIDPAHIAHEAAHRWFGDSGHAAWATCSVTENGVLRIVGNPKYPNSPGSPAAVVPILARLRAMQGHEYWTEDLSLVADRSVDPSAIKTPGQVTDTFLLALAATRGGLLATFDRRLSVKAVRGGVRALYLIPGAN